MRISRRHFLIGMGALAGSLITGRASWAHHRPGHNGGPPSPSPTPPPDPSLSGTRKLLLLI